MYKHIAALVSAAALFMPSVATANTAVATWEGEVKKSCTLEPLNIGTVVFNGATGWNSRLDSSISGGNPVELQVQLVGGSGTLNYVRGSASVTRDGQEVLQNSVGPKSELKMGTGPWQLTYTAAKIGITYAPLALPQGLSTVDIHTRTSAHLNFHGEPVTGTYVVKHTLECKLD